jgi:multidrug efflux pump
MIVGLHSPDGRYRDIDVADYIASNILDPLSRVDGVGNLQFFGSPYAMRIWLDPAKLASYSLTPADVVAAVQAQNAQVASGQLGGTPAVPGTALNATITAQSRLQTPDQFRQIILKDTEGGAHVYLRDVAKVEIGSESYTGAAKYNNMPAAALAVQLAPGGNAIETGDAVREKMAELSKAFPPGLKFTIAFDSTPFVEKSIEEVVKTLAEAIVLVVLVIFLFLQNWRATIIPTIAVPVVLLGTFGILAVLGYSINTLTMFGLVLAIGMLVDDAIVVVENVERLMTEEGLSPKEAAYKSMQEITGALVGIGLVLSAVFVPMAFFGGSQGIIYRNFSVTLVAAVTLSVLVALILTPALCATMLKPSTSRDHDLSKPGFFGWFNRNFDHASGRYQEQVRRILGQGGRWMVGYGVIVLLIGYLFLRLPSAFLPEEDQGQMMAVVQLPAGSSYERTQGVMQRLANHFLADPAVDSIFTVSGFSFAGTGQNAGNAFIRLKPFEERKSADLKAPAAAQRAMGAFSQFRDAMAFPIVPPAVPELGIASGFDFQLQDTAGIGHAALVAASQQLLGMAAQDPDLAGVRPNGMADTPQLTLDIDHAKAGAMGVSVADINSTLSTAIGGSYVDDFIDRGRTKRVYVQGDAPFRMSPEDLARWHVRNKNGQMVPFSAFATSHWVIGSPRLERYNGLPSINIQGSAVPGKSTGDAMAAMERLAAKLPPGVGYSWTGISLQERESGAQAPLLYALSVLVVFLLLAALYESWTIPLAVIFVIPLGIVGALLANSARGLSNDIYFQVGLLTIMGLASKNAILIVEFARDAQKAGRPLVEAILEAVRIRLRPILMTSFAFIFGVVPLAISNGPGSGSHHSIGTGVIGGMLSAVVLGIFFIPLFYFLVQRHLRRRRKAGEPLPEGAE